MYRFSVKSLQIFICLISLSGPFHEEKKVWSFDSDHVFYMAKVRPSRLFLRPFSIKYMIPPHNFLKKIWLLKPKYDIFEENFRNLLRFSQICREIFKIIKNPCTLRYLMFGMNLRPPRAFKMTENDPWLKKSGHPWYRLYWN